MDSNCVCEPNRLKRLVSDFVKLFSLRLLNERKPDVEPELCGVKYMVFSVCDLEWTEALVGFTLHTCKRFLKTKTYFNLQLVI